MKRTIYIVIGIYLLLIGCNKNEDSVNQNDSIVELAYSKDYYYPAGFYHETIDSGSIYYENMVSISPANNRKNIWIDLSSTDINQAKAWSELSNQNSSVNRPIAKELSNEKYFEFVRVSATNSKDIVLSRVHNRNYFVPFFNKFNNNDTVGQFIKANFQKTDVKELIEYLWSSGVIGYPNKVLESNINENAKNYEQVIKSISIIYGDWGLNDCIYLFDNTFKINKQTGLITMTKVQTDLIKGKYCPNPL